MMIFRLSVISLLCLAPTVAGALTRDALIRYPNVHGNSIVFVARNTLWTVSTQGGTATKIQGVPDEPAAPRYSPDGKWIAFTARLGGNQDVFVIPSAGGTVRRLTWSADVSPTARPWWGPNNLVVNWTPDSRNVLFLTRKTTMARAQPELYSVAVAGGLPVRSSLRDAASISYSGNGEEAAITRTFTSYRPWKRYDGGLAPDISVFNFKSKSLEKLTDWKGTDDFPMWQGSRIFFISDRDANRRANLWVMDATGGHAQELTRFTDQDIDFPSLGDDRIAFQQGGKLWSYATNTGVLQTVPVSVPDDGVTSSRRTIDIAPMIRSADVTGEHDYAISPDGGSVLFSAMGEIELSGQHKVENLTRTDAIDEDHPAWSPDGKTMAYATDRSGEQEIVVRSIDGGTERVLTRTKTGYYYTPAWSADGRSLVVADAGHALWLLHANGFAPVRIAVDPAAEIRDASFSPNSSQIMFSTLRNNQQRALHLFDIETRSDTVVSSPMNSDWSPRFSADGRELFFLSNRHSQPVASDRDTDMVPVNSAGLYRAPIRDGVPLMSDATPFALPGGSYALIGAYGDHLFALEHATPTLGGSVEGATSKLHRLDVHSGADSVMARGAESVDISRDGRYLAWFDGELYRRLDITTGAETPVDVAGMRAEVALTNVWKEMFENAWRLQRDMYYSASMDGADINRTRRVLEKILPLVASTSDFNYLIGELQGELGSSHMYYASPAPSSSAEPEALLGIDLVLDPESHAYRIQRIVPGDNSRPALRSPLKAPGITVADGEFILAINGHPLSPTENPDRFLAGVTGSVRLTVASSPAGVPRDVVVKPLTSELALRRFDFTERSRQEVDRLSNGRLGYIYMSDMAEAGTSQFINQFYPQQDKDGLVLDVRWNSGGFTAQLILERLRRTVVGIFINRQQACSSLPDGAVDGPKIVITNHYTASDGDQFPYFFRAYGLGKVIGTRTWGGVRGILGAWPLMDGTSVNIPKDVLLSTSGERIIENEGTSPDIEVDSDVDGNRDIQLERAVAELLPQIKQRRCDAQGAVF